jgi:hypothetical protein
MSKPWEDFSTSAVPPWELFQGTTAVADAPETNEADDDYLQNVREDAEQSAEDRKAAGAKPIADDAQPGQTFTKARFAAASGIAKTFCRQAHHAISRSEGGTAGKSNHRMGKTRDGQRAITGESRPDFDWLNGPCPSPIDIPKR